MGKEPTSVLIGYLVEEEGNLSLPELCEACGVGSDWVVELVEEGVVEAHGRNRNEWHFAASCLPRIHTAIHLQRDLGINLSGVALALQLLDEINTLQARLQAMGYGDWPEEE